MVAFSITIPRSPRAHIAASISPRWRPIGRGCSLGTERVRLQKKLRISPQTHRIRNITIDFRDVNPMERMMRVSHTYAMPPSVKTQSAVGKFPASTPVMLVKA
jgi:hypothetical protein